MVASAWNEEDLLSSFARACDGRADADEVRRLDERLASDPRARQLWLEYISVHGGVSQHLAETTALVDWTKVFADEQSATSTSIDSAEDDKVERAARAPRGRRSTNHVLATAQAVVRFARSYPVLTYSIAIVVVLVEVAVLALVTLPGRRSPIADDVLNPQIVARLTRSVDAQWREGEQGVEEDAPLATGQFLELLGGMAEITFQSGAKVIVEGPAEFHVDSRNSCSLTRGKLTANVPPPARGFVVDTGRGRVIDLGTRFAVDVSSLGDVAIHCFRGEVMYDVPEQKTVTLTAGQAIAYSSGRQRRMSPKAGDFVHDLRLHGDLHRDPSGMVVDERFLRNVAQGKKVSQSSTLSNYKAELAVDGNRNNFTHTTMEDRNAWLMVDLGELHDIDAVVLHNRSECCGERLQNVIVEILAEDGRLVVFASEKLNENNRDKAPRMLAVGLPEATGDVVRGRYVRIRREATPGEPGNVGAVATLRVLSLSEVQIFAEPVPPTTPATSNKVESKPSK